MNILIVEDEAVIREGVSEFLKEQGYDVTEAADGEEGLLRFREKEFQLVILDIMMPKVDGIEMLKEIRRSSQVPVIMLTAMNDEPTQVKSFDEKADDYISKPFSLIILKKRVEALLRRNYPQAEHWSYQETEVDFQGFRGFYQGQEVDVKPKEIRLLAYLLENRGKVLTRSQILDHIWEEGSEPFDRVIDVYIKNLRKKLHLDCIRTVKGIGYKIE